jgi:membrane protein
MAPGGAIPSRGTMDIDTLSADKLQHAARRQASWAIGAFRKFAEDRCAAMAAGIAFYAAFSLAPTLVMVIAVAGWFFGAQAARGELFAHIHGLLGDQAAAGVQVIVQNARHAGGAGGIAAIISFVLLAIGASATFSSLNSALNIVWPLTGPRSSSVIALVRVRLISFGLVLDTAITFIGQWLWGNSPYVVIGNLLQLLVGLLVLAFAFAALLKFLPDAMVRWRDAMVGGVVAAVLFSAGKKLFALYIAHAGMANSFGAAGSLAVLLMWLYFSAVVLLLGAEFSAARGRLHDPRGAWGQQEEAPAGSRAKLASVLAASTIPAQTPGNPAAGAKLAAKTGGPAADGGLAGAMARGMASATDASGASGNTGSEAGAGSEQQPQAARRAATATAVDIRAVASIGRKVVHAEGQATRAAASTLREAGRKASAADRYVRHNPWRSILMAAGAAILVTTVAGRRRGDGASAARAADGKR